MLSKYATFRHNKSKESPDVLADIMEGPRKVGNTPKLLYSDEEGTLYSKPVMEYLKDEKTEMHRTRGHPAFAELFTRT